MPTADLSPDLDAFIARWRASSAAERANYVLFLSELCTVLDLERPNPQTSDPALDAYVFEKPLPLPHGTVGRIDLYKRGCFVLEAKQGSDAHPNPDRQGGERGDPSLTVGVRTGRSTPRRRGTAVRNTSTWDVAMERARRQAETYARSLPPAEVADGRPPFLVVIDVGATFEFYSEFTRSGGNYIPFPDPGRHRVTIEDLRRPEVRELLAAVWHDPLSLDPARRSAAVTRAISTQLAALARSLETAHPPDAVAHFLMRCLFTMFAEDVGLLPVGSFTELLDVAHADPASFAPLAAELWRTMKHGGYSVALRRQVAHFNGKLFADADALPLNAEQVALLVAAARADWRDVEPAIFGTLLERALDPRERHKLGAHYTPRAYVERLVWPTVIAPLRQEWDNVKAAALIFQQNGQERLAIQVVADFQQRLARLRVLDPACGTANFLYVTLEHLKRLEAEVLELLRELGHGQLPLELEGVTVTPAQFLGIEVNPRAAAIAELVLWIGYLQWHYRAERDAPLRQPILADQPAIDCRDAVLAWDGTTPQLDDAGQPVTRWDGRTFKRHPVTGEWTPDEHARTPVDRYLNPRPAAWPAADFIVGNPPYIGTARMRELLGDGYAEAIRRVYPNVPAAADYVMYWWDKAAELVRGGQVQRFGFITTNSLRQVYDRRVIEHHLSAEPSLSLLFAIPDHPWVDAADGAAVRVAMTTAVAGNQAGILSNVIREEEGEDDAVELDLSVTHGRVSADLRIGADVAGAAALLANSNLSSRGMQLFGAGFIVTPEEAARLGYGQDPAVAQVIKPYRNGRDLMQTPRAVLVIDLFGLSEDEVRSRYPAIYQWVYERVKPERDVNRRASYRDRWWIHGEARANLRPALAGLPRYIATVETAKHRVFVFLDQAILPDNMLVAIALDDAWFLGVLSSRIHVIWALAAGGRLGVGNDPRYTKSRCFEPFPFPAADAAQQAHIRALAEQIDAHRKRQQALHPGLTLTDMYNVLERLRILHPNPDREGGAARTSSLTVAAQIPATHPNPDREGGQASAGKASSLTVAAQMTDAQHRASQASSLTVAAQIPATHPNPDREGGQASAGKASSLTVAAQIAATHPNPDREGGQASAGRASSLTVAAQIPATHPNPDREGGQASAGRASSLTVAAQIAATHPNPDREGGQASAGRASSLTVAAQIPAAHPNPDREGGQASAGKASSLTVAAQMTDAQHRAGEASSLTVAAQIPATHPNPDREGGQASAGKASSLTVAAQMTDAQHRAGKASSLTVAAQIPATHPNPDREGGQLLAEAPAPYDPIPLAYFITFHTYGTWLPGDEEGSVDFAHNVPGTPMLPPDPIREAEARGRMDQPPYTMDEPRRAIVLQAIQEVCTHRGWSLLASHVRTNHVHVVVYANQIPRKVMNDFKAYASRHLNDNGFDQHERKRWVRHGSTRYLWQPEHVEAAIHYVVHEQGEPMAVYENLERNVTYAPITFGKVLKEAGEVYEATSLFELPVFQIEDTEAAAPPNPDREGGQARASLPSLTVGVRNEAAPPLTPKERQIHEDGLLTVLRQLHDELDAAVAAAYGWPADLPDDAILQRLVDLNAQRAAEEAQGAIRWLRPAYQAPRAGLAAPVQAPLVEEEAASTPPVAAAALPWPEAMPAQAAAVRAVLARAPRPLSAAEVAAAFAGPAGKRAARVAELLETLAALGQAAAVEDGRYAAG